jgi:predicted ABC-type transport system involved in lysophospholipase L1 biosynthesis ATPase subunit
LQDEPTGELDTQTGEGIANLLYGVCRERNISMVVATHDQNIAKKADIVYQMRDGILRQL